MCNAGQHSTAHHSTAHHSTAQHSTAQHSTAQHSTAQHSTADLPVEGSVSSIGTAVKSNAFQLPLSFFGFMRGPCERLAPAAGGAAAAGAVGATLLLQTSSNSVGDVGTIHQQCYEPSARWVAEDLLLEMFLPQAKHDCATWQSMCVQKNKALSLMPHCQWN